MRLLLRVMLIIVGLFALEGGALASDGSIHGAVRTRHGVPVVGATVSVASVAEDGKAEHIAVKTDARGSFLINELPAGDYSVAASYGRWSSVRSSVGVAAAIPSRVNFYFDGDRPADAWDRFYVAESAGSFFTKDFTSEGGRGDLAVGAETMMVGAGARGLVDFLVLRPRVTLETSRAIYHGSIDLVAKDPDVGDEDALQSAALGVDVALSARGAAYVHVAAGRQRFELGGWSTADVGGSWRREVFSFFATETRLGVKTTSLFNADERGDQWIAEAAFGSRLLFALPCIKSRTWLGAELSFPLAHSGGAALGRLDGATSLAPMGELSPRTSVGVELGFLLGAISDWDLYARLAIRDRGSADVGGSTLPILVDGSDQTQVTIGLARRFGGGE